MPRVAVIQAATAADFEATLAKAGHLLLEAAEHPASLALLPEGLPGRAPESLRAHKAIVEAIGDRHPERAASEMTSHMRGSARAFTFQALTSLSTPPRARGHAASILPA